MKKFPFDTQKGIILCKAKLSNRKQSLFIKLVVDTGASFTMIPVETAQALGIDPFKSTLPPLEISTANGIVLAPLIKIPLFTCFGVTYKNIEIICHNLPQESCAEGLLGLNFLKKTKIIIDFAESIIKIPY